MRLSSGLKHALCEAGSWLFAAAVGFCSILWFDELKAGLAHTLGLPMVDQVAIAAINDAPPERATGSVQIKAGAHGHFMAMAHINGRQIDVMVDTGASIVALTYEDAQRAGIYVRPADFTARVATANGVAHVAPVTLDSVSIGDITLRNVEAAVSEPGRLGTTLLGMTFIGRLSRAEMRNGVLVLQE